MKSLGIERTNENEHVNDGLRILARIIAMDFTESTKIDGASNNDQTMPCIQP